MIASKLSLLSLILLAFTPAGDAFGQKSLRGVQEATKIHRRLPAPHPHPHSSSSSSPYMGCLDYTSDQLSEMWPDGPDCGDSDDSDDATDDAVVESEEDAYNSTDPYTDFDIGNCETYENLWRWDLHLSCGGGDNNNVDSCNCTFAEELFNEELLTCEDREECPQGCPICSTCLSILGCEEPNIASLLSKEEIIYIIVASVLFLIIALALIHSCRKKNNASDLNQHLIDDYANDMNPSQSSQRGFQPPVVPFGGAVVKGGKADSETDGEEDTVDGTLDDTLINTASVEDVPDDELIEDEIIEEEIIQESPTGESDYVSLPPTNLVESPTGESDMIGLVAVPTAGSTVQEDEVTPEPEIEESPVESVESEEIEEVEYESSFEETVEEEEIETVEEEEIEEPEATEPTEEPAESQADDLPVAPSVEDEEPALPAAPSEESIPNVASLVSSFESKTR